MKRIYFGRRPPYTIRTFPYVSLHIAIFQFSRYAHLSVMAFASALTSCTGPCQFVSQRQRVTDPSVSRTVADSSPLNSAIPCTLSSISPSKTLFPPTYGANIVIYSCVLYIPNNLNQDLWPIINVNDLKKESLAAVGSNPATDTELFQAWKLFTFLEQFLSYFVSYNICIKNLELNLTRVIKNVIYLCCLQNEHIYQTMTPNLYNYAAFHVYVVSLQT